MVKKISIEADMHNNRMEYSVATRGNGSNVWLWVDLESGRH